MTIGNSTQPTRLRLAKLNAPARLRFSKNAFSKFGALCGPLAILFFFVGLPGGGFLPPIPPYRSAQGVVRHYEKHEHGIKAAASLMTFVGFFYPMYTAAISGQISRIPGVPKAVLQAQVIGGTLGGLFLALPAYFFAITVYRLERPPELTQLMNDISWILFAMPFSSLLVQDFSFSYAIILDERPRPLFPPWLALVTSGLTLTFWPALGVHCVRRGAVAWHGGLAFWGAGVGGALQIFIMAFYVWKAVDRTDIPADGDKE